MECVKMLPVHVQQVAELEKLCFSSPWSEKAISGELNNPLALWVVAVEADCVLGYIGSQAVMDEADVMNLAVIPQARCKGVGRALVETLVKELAAIGVTSLTLEVRASNETALRLYDRLGFVQVGRRPGYYFAPREDALILRKEWTN